MLRCEIRREMSAVCAEMRDSTGPEQAVCAEMRDPLGDECGLC